MTDLLRNQSPTRMPLTLSTGAVVGFGEHGPGDLDDPHDASLLEQELVAVASEHGSSPSALTVGDLRAEAEARGLEVEGTGKDGRVVKADLVAALNAADLAVAAADVPAGPELSTTNPDDAGTTGEED